MVLTNDLSFLLPSVSGRNYMLSTLTPVSCPEGCGIVVNGQEAPIVPDGPTLVLDNTFLHHVFNHHGSKDRYCLMAECWHPDLTRREVKALSTLFAAKDRFTVLDLELAPWGYDDDYLEWGLKNGAVNDLDFWSSLDYMERKKDELLSKKIEGPRRKGSKRKTRPSTKGFGP